MAVGAADAPVPMLSGARNRRFSAGGRWRVDPPTAGARDPARIRPTVRRVIGPRSWARSLRAPALVLAAGCGDPAASAPAADAGIDVAGDHRHPDLDAAPEAAPVLDADAASPGRSCFPVGARCAGARYECLCGPTREWECRGPFSHIPKPPHQPFEFFFGCQQGGIECSRFGPCHPVCRCEDFDWACEFDEDCAVPSCPIVPPPVGGQCAAALGQVCPYQAGNGGVAVCICEPLSARGAPVWSCSPPAPHGR